MLKILVKKQLTEIFRNYFYDQKKNKMRPKTAIISHFLLYFLVIFGVFGGMIGSYATSMCAPVCNAGFDWLYFAIFAGIAIAFGSFGSVFSTYSILYLSKDNDSLLSMPIPEKYIVFSRLLSVYLLGCLYSSAVILPAIVIYWIKTPFSFAKIICDVILLIQITLFVLLLSCILGFLVAKLSIKLKNRSVVTVLVSLLGIGIYYYLYFNANKFIEELCKNPSEIGSKIKGSAYVIYKFGMIGAGDYIAAGCFFTVLLAVLLIIWLVLKKTFISIATSSAVVGKKKAREKKHSQKSPFSAALGKEFTRFFTSPNYMLNCGFGIIMLIVFSVIFLFKGTTIINSLSQSFAGFTQIKALIVCAGVMVISTTIDIAAVSISLEGKNIWIIQSLPISPKTVLRAKMAAHFILAIFPIIFAGICGIIVIKAKPVESILILATIIIFELFLAIFNLLLNLRLPYMVWSNELYPIKQGGSIVAALFGGMGIVFAFGVIYILAARFLGTAITLIVWNVIISAVGIALYKNIMTKGAESITKL